MLTIRQNFLETIGGGSPDRFVKQFEYMKLVMDPIIMNCAGFCAPGQTSVKDWGFTVCWPQGSPGPMPVHNENTIALKDITKWKETLKAPDPRKYPAEMWAAAEAEAAQVDRSQRFVACFVATGLFEKLHYLMSIEETLVNFYEEPEAMHELIDFLADWEIECAKVQIEHLHPDALFHHDDWGTQTNSFFAPEMFADFFVPAYKKIYNFWKNNGVEVVIHHSDSYAANLVPHMIECGIDVYQGAVSDNNIPLLIKQYGGKIAFQGGIDNIKYDVADWSREEVRKGLRELIDAAGTKYLIPGLVAGGPISVYPGLYEAVSEEVEALDKVYFSPVTV